MSDNIKQVIIVRKDLNMRKGKIASQVAHACMRVFFDKLNSIRSYGELQGWSLGTHKYFEEFITGKFKKIVVYVNSEQELLDVYQKAQDAGLHSSLIRDAGLTEFKGVPTYTTACIGPWEATAIDAITGKLPLL